MDEGTYEQIRYEVAERVATITLDRAERRNAVTYPMLDDLVPDLVVRPHVHSAPRRA